MRWLLTIARLIVGALFIFSGLIKVNDPVGTAIKLEEYFAVFGSNFSSIFEIFVPWALPLSVILVVLEVVLGVAVLINYRMSLTAWILLLLIFFFTFLTFYSAYTGEVTDCGCFGDAIKLTPWESFIKDIILLVLIAYLFINRKKLAPLLAVKTGAIVISLGTIMTLFLAIYAIRHLPYIDFRAYKVGADIPASMQPSEPLQYSYLMEREGVVQEFEEYPTDTSFVYKDIKLLNPEAQPKITDYSLWEVSGNNVTQQSFTGVQLIIIIHYVEKAETDVFSRINTLIDEVEGQVGVMVLTASDEQSFESFRHQVQLAAPFYFGDATVLKTMVRSNPGVLLLRDGQVLGKWHWRDTPDGQEVKTLAGL